MMEKRYQRIKNRLKKCCLLVFVVGLLISQTSFIHADEVTYVTGTYGHSPNQYNHTLYDSFIYSDSFFDQSSYNADIHLAILSLVLAETSISAKDVDYSEKSQNLTQFLTKVGFQDIAVNDDYKIKPTQDTFAVAVAYKQLGDTVLLAIVPRSAGYEVEWGDNFNIGSSGLHAGFERARNICLNYAKEYVSSRSDIFDGKTVKVWVSGYSRGAGVANVIGAALDDDSNSYLGLDVSKENIFTYTFGTPLTATSDLNPSAEKYHNIHNYYSDYDMSTMMPLSTWGFERYGENIELDVHNGDTKAKMLPLLKQMNEYIYDVYTAENSLQDPDNFTPMTLEVNDGSYIITKDTSSEITTPTTLKAFLEDRVNILSNTVFKDRATYAEKYQEAMMEIAKLLKGESSENVATFMSTAKANESFQPLLVMLFFYDMVEEQTRANTGKDLPENWQDQIKAMVPEPGSGTGTVVKVTNSAVYKEIYDRFTSKDIGKKYEIEVKTYDDLLEVYRLMARDDLDVVLKAGLTAIGYDTTSQLITKKENEMALCEVGAELLFGSNVTSGYGDKIYISISKAKIALTLLGNTFNRVHNHEIMISWMRAMDSNPIEVNEEVYAITGDSTCTKGSLNALQLSYDKGTVTKIKVDGYEIDASKYTIDQENKTVQLSSSVLEELKVGTHMVTFVFDDNKEAYHEFKVVEPEPTPTYSPTSAPTASPTVAPTTSPTTAPTVAPTTTPEAKKSSTKKSSGWDDGGPFTTDTCGNVFDRWGNKIYEAKGCNVGGYNLVRTSTH